MSLFNIINKNYVFSFFMKLYIPFLKLLTGVIRAHINMTDIYIYKLKIINFMIVF